MNIDSLIDNYYNWLKDKTAIKQVKDWIEITTPYLDRHNDYIQIYLKQDGDDYLLTDDGYTIQDLEQSGCSIDSVKRQKILEVTLNGFGVHKRYNEIYIKTNYNNFPMCKHNLIQAILSVNDIFYLVNPKNPSLFFEDVQSWLDQNDIRFLERVPFIGKSGYSRHYDFVIPKSRNKPERMIKTVNDANKSKVDELVFSWLDTKDVRMEDAKAYAFVNDSQKSMPPIFKDALLSYNIAVIPWTQRNQFSNELAA
jgi:hypothetical protein